MRHDTDGSFKNDTTALLHRLDRLECRSRRQRIVLGLLASALVVAALAGAASQVRVRMGPNGPIIEPTEPEPAQRDPRQSQQQQGSVQGEIVCRGLAIVDGNGGTRMLARVQDDGHCFFALRDRNGNDRVRMQVNNDGSTGMVFVDQNGRTRLSHRIGTDGTVSSVYSDGQGADRLSTGIDTMGTAAVMCRAPGGGAASTIGLGCTQAGCPQGYGPLFSMMYKLLPKDPCAP